jgi:hypothetical protein
MSYVIAVPELISSAATDLANIGSSISEANAAAATPTMSVLAAGADEVSTAIAEIFGARAQGYQAIGGDGFDKPGAPGGSGGERC